MTFAEVAGQKFLDQRWAQGLCIPGVIDRLCGSQERRIDLLVEIVIDDTVDAKSDDSEKNREPDGVAQRESQSDWDPVK